MVNWKAGDSNQRLMAAIIAVHPVKVDLNAVALAFGRGATVRAIGHQLAHLRELAKTLNEEVKSSGLTRAPRGTEKDGASAEPQTPRAKTPRSGGNTSGVIGKEKRKRNAVEGSVERLLNPIRGSRVQADQDDEVSDMADVEAETPSKGARKPAQRRKLVADDEGHGTEGDNDVLHSPSAEAEDAPEEPYFYDGDSEDAAVPEEN